MVFGTGNGGIRGNIQQSGMDDSEVGGLLVHAAVCRRTASSRDRGTDSKGNDGIRDGDTHCGELEVACRPRRATWARRAAMP